MSAKVLVVDDDRTLTYLLRMELEFEGFEVVSAADGAEAIDKAIDLQPDVVLLDLVMPDMSGLEVLEELRSRPQTVTTPVIMLTGRPLEAGERDALERGADYYMTKPFEIETLVSRLHAVITRTGSARDVSPLTGLPGNTHIEREIDDRIATDDLFSLIHADIDNFKALNDYYGFTRGDRVISFCAGVLMRAVAELQLSEAFVGHIGGDDFAVIVNAGDTERYCKTALELFDQGIVNFYDDEDKALGFVEIEDRTGDVQRFPISTLSMGVSTNVHRRLSSAAEASTIAAEMKSYAKKVSGSNFQIDRRLS